MTDEFFAAMFAVIVALIGVVLWIVWGRPKEELDDSTSITESIVNAAIATAERQARLWPRAKAIIEMDRHDPAVRLAAIAEFRRLCAAKMDDDDVIGHVAFFCFKESGGMRDPEVVAWLQTVRNV